MPRLSGTLCSFLLTVLLAGCATDPWPTARERAESGQALAGQCVDGQPLIAFLQQRTAFLVTGAVPVSVRQVDQHIEMDLQTHYTFGVGTDRLSAFRFATAVALTRDGYFMSAAHSLKPGQPLYVCVPAPGKTLVAQARVVWAGAPDQGQDFALVKADVAPPAVFEWLADRDLRPGAALAIYGPYGLGSGRLQDVLDRPSSAATNSTLVAHDLPLVQGDSGGPLTTCTGKLVGINIGAEHTGLNPMTPWRKLAVRPDLEWVQRTIAQDRAAHAAPAGAAAPPPPAAKS